MTAKEKCKFCGKSISVSNMTKHQKTGKCLTIQGIHNISNSKCIACGETFTRIDYLKSHQKSCKKLHSETITSIEDNLRKQNFELESKLATKSHELVEITDAIMVLHIELKLAKKEIAVLKANPTVINNNNNIDNSIRIKVDKFVVKKHATDNFVRITDSLTREVLMITPDPCLLLGGAESIARLILETSLAGRNKVACTDLSRLILHWKDIDSTIVVDPKLCKLMPRLCRPIYQTYNDLWRQDMDMESEQFRAIGSVLNKLDKIVRKTDKNSRFYNQIVKLISIANCDLSFMLEDEEEEVYEYDSSSSSD